MGAGRPTEYREEYARQVIFLCKRGATDEELGQCFGVSARTIERWRKAHPEFCRAVKEGKDLADGMVERSLFERATGYSHPDTKFATFEGEITDEKEYVKHYPPDTTAAIFWLKNRKPEDWRDKQEIEHSMSEWDSFFEKLEPRSGLHNEVAAGPARKKPAKKAAKKAAKRPRKKAARKRTRND